MTVDELTVDELTIDDLTWYPLCYFNLRDFITPMYFLSIRVPPASGEK